MPCAPDGCGSRHGAGSLVISLARDLGSFPLAAGGRALRLQHRKPALALAGILALAIVLSALAIALALAAVDAEAAALDFLRHGGADQSCPGDDAPGGCHPK